MSEKSVSFTIKDSDSNSYDPQTIDTSTLVVPVSTTGIPISETTHGSFFNGTQIAYGAVIEKTTGTFFQVDFVDNYIVKYTYSYNSSTESILSFLDIVNNKEGWSFLQQRCVNSTISN